MGTEKLRDVAGAEDKLQAWKNVKGMPEDEMGTSAQRNNSRLQDVHDFSRYVETTHGERPPSILELP